jgi:hypothetical protein
MTLSLTDYDDPKRFHDAVVNHLLQSEAECCLQLGLIGRMASGYAPLSIDELDRPMLWVVRNGDQIETVAIQTMKKMMTLIPASAEAAEFMAEQLADRQWTGRYIVGVSPSIGILSKRFASLTGRAGKLVLALRAFQLTAVTWPPAQTGTMRKALPADRKVLARYLKGFENDIGEHSLEDAETRADRMIGQGQAFLWADSDPVAVATWAGPTPHGIRIGFVYTPPEFRGRGYASNLVAHLSQSLLNEGRQFCFLYTDRANPTSNSIYQKLGYRPVCDSERWEFT